MILVCGEALLDLVEVEQSEQGPLLRALPGGSPANAAIALARLGEAVALATRLGGDTGGELIRAHLESNGVDLRFVVTAAEPTTLAMVTLGEGGEARYAFYFDATASACWREGDLPGPEGIEAVHVGSMALAAPPGRRVIRAFIDSLDEHVTLSLDPNVRLGVVADVSTYRSDLEALCVRADLVRVSSDDLERLYPERSTIEAAEAWSGLGPRLVVVSRGAAGPLAFFGGEQVVGATPKVDVVDTVGAGDTFSAALLHRFAAAGVLTRRLAGISRSELDEALWYSAVAASITCERQGAHPPTAQEVEARLARLEGAGRARRGEE